MTAAPLDLDALEAAERVATRAPWRHEPMYPMMIGHRNVVHTGGADPVHFGVSEHKDGSFEDAALTVALRNAAPALFAAARERDKLREALEAAVEVISGYEEWEASIILDTSCWSGDGFPHLNQSKFDRMLELQAARNAARAKARAALGKPSVTSSTSDPSPK